jgi:hypothetical protein
MELADALDVLQRAAQVLPDDLDQHRQIRDGLEDDGQLRRELDEVQRVADPEAVNQRTEVSRRDFVLSNSIL